MSPEYDADVIHDVRSSGQEEVSVLVSGIRRYGVVFELTDWKTCSDCSYVLQALRWVRKDVKRVRGGGEANE